MPISRNPARRIAALTLAAAAACLPLAHNAAAQVHHRHAGGRAVRHLRHGAMHCPGADTRTASLTQGEARRAVLCLINQQRRRHGLPPLSESARLDRSAQGWTDYMVRTGRFTHGADFAARISAVGFAWGSAGENIATGFVTPRQVVRGWMGSQGHCSNILDPTYASVGTGVDTRPLGRFGGATWTQDFALWMGHRAPSRNYGPARGCPYRT